jgi:hypothetical protein
MRTLLASERFGDRPKSGIVATSLRRSLPLAISLVFVALSLTGSRGSEIKTVTFGKAKASERTAPLIIGANVHYGLRRVLGYTSAEEGLKQLAYIKATSFRDYILWSSYKSGPSSAKLVAAKRLMNFLPKAQLQPLINIGSPNREVEGSVSPVSERALPYFKSYIRQVVQDTKQYHPIYEIWNEWNIDLSIGKPEPRLKGAGDPADGRAAVHYPRIAKAAIKEIRSVDPDAVILVGAIGDDPDWEWAKSIVRDGALEGADALSIHLYNHCLPKTQRTANELIERAKALQADLMKLRGGAVTPIYVTEYGWPTHIGDACSIPPEVAATNFAQFILQAATVPWIKGIWMHELKNIGEDAQERENNFGLFTYDDKPKPAACFVREATEIVQQADNVQLKRPFPDVFIARIRQGDRQKIIVWSSRQQSQAKFRMPDGSPDGKMMCSSQTLSGKEPKEIGPVPVVYDLGETENISVTVTR